MSVTVLLSPLCSRSEVKTFLGIAASDTSQDDLLDLAIDAATGAINDYVGYPLLTPSGDTPAEYYSGDGTPDLILRRRPVASITSIYVDANGYWGQGSDPFPATTLLVAGTDYALIRDEKAGATRSIAGMVRRLASSIAGSGWYGGAPMYPGGTLTNFGRSKPVWPVGEGNIKATYVAGFTSLTSATNPVPPAVQQACAMLAVWIKRSTPYGGFSSVSESLSKYSVSFGQLAQSAGNALAAAGELGSVRQALSRYREAAL